MPGKKPKRGKLRVIKKLFLNDKFIFTLIIVNSVIIFIGGFKSLENQILHFSDMAITLLFVIEAVIKISVYGWRRYIDSHWNKLDFILVIFSFPSMILNFFPAHLTDLSFLLVLRVSRVFKFFRFFKFIPGIDQLIRGIRRALKDSILVLLGFMVFNFVIAILSGHLFKDIAPKYFGDPLNSLYSTFKIFTIEGWYDIPDMIAKEATPTIAFFTKIYFVVILIVGGILGLSLVNSIFVDAMVSDNNDDIRERIASIEKKIDAILENKNLKE